MPRPFFCLLLLLVFLGLPAPVPAQTNAASVNAAGPIRITLLGDSLMSDEPPARAQQGWGTYFQEHLRNAKVTNLASSGRSTKTFLEGDPQPDGTIKPPLKWPKVLTTPADYWLISFGGNDIKSDYRHTDPEGSFTDNLEIMIKAARQRGVTPVLIAPAHWPPLLDFIQPMGPYADAVRKLAKKENVPLMDLYDFSTQFYAKEGADSVKYQPPELRGHVNRAGAEMIAAEMARQFSQIEPRVAQKPAAAPATVAAPAAVPAGAP